jgi:CBS domain-containing protein
MPVINKRSVLSGITVREAMRRQVVHLPLSAAVDTGIGHMIKYKVNAILITTPDHRPQGVVSKTDVIGAYYATLPIDSPLENIMVGPPLFCYPDDGLESALQRMHTEGVHRLYVRGAASEQVIGVLAYPDIIGLLYRYCRVCDRNIRRAKTPGDDFVREPLKVAEVMTTEVVAQPTTASIARVIEALAAHKLGAVLITDAHGLPIGVASKTDLVIAYRRGKPVDARIGEIMHASVHTCKTSADLSTAIQLMLLKDIQRIFVAADDGDRITGVLSLSDAARFRSGSCRACVAGRMMTSA